MIPAGVWPAPRPGDSYVFDPAPLSGIWAQRVLVPVLTVGANVLVLVSLIALYRRDRNVMPRWQRWSAWFTVLGVVAWLFGTYLITTVDPNDIVVGVFGGLLAILALLLTVPGLVVWGAGYYQTGRRRLGAALAGAPIFTVVYIGVSLAGVDFDPLGGVLLVTPTAGMALFVGYNLWVVETPQSQHQQAGG
jgi:multisubunit Na+/H+ antiporter MnhG subunit